MALSDLKFTETDFAGRDISSLPDVPSAAGITAAELKARFDAVGKVLVALGAFNTLLELLGGSRGAAQIGADEIGTIPAGSVQDALEALYGALSEKPDRDNTVAYTPSGDYSLATKKYVDDAVAAALQRG